MQRACGAGTQRGGQAAGQIAADCCLGGPPKNTDNQNNTNNNNNNNNDNHNHSHNHPHNNDDVNNDSNDDNDDGDRTKYYNNNNNRPPAPVARSALLEVFPSSCAALTLARCGVLLPNSAPAQWVPKHILKLLARKRLGTRWAEAPVYLAGADQCRLRFSDAGRRSHLSAPDLC